MVYIPARDRYRDREAECRRMGASILNTHPLSPCPVPNIFAAFAEGKVCQPHTYVDTQTGLTLPAALQVVLPQHHQTTL
jgi:hypothetical protein